MDVLHLELCHQSGPPRHFAGNLAAKEINIAAGHARTVKGSKKASVVLAVLDLDKSGSGSVGVREQSERLGE